MTIHRPVLKQKHKPFKGSNKSKSSIKPKALSKPNVESRLHRNAKKANLIAKNKNLKASLHVESPRNVFVLPFHQNANAEALFNEISALFASSSDSLWRSDGAGWMSSPVLLLSENQIRDGIPRRLFFYSCPRRIADILYCAATADVILCLFSGSNPEEPAFDDFGYKALSAIRRQGIPAVLGVNLEQKSVNIQASTTLVRRYFTSEFGTDKKFCQVSSKDDLQSMLTTLAGLSLKQLTWRKDRGYLLATDYLYEDESQSLVLQGYAKGLGFSVRHAVHLTGIGDFILDRIEMCTDPCPVKHGHSKASMDANFLVEEQNPELLQILAEQVEIMAPKISTAINNDPKVDELTVEMIKEFEKDFAVRVQGDVDFGDDLQLDTDADADADSGAGSDDEDLEINSQVGSASQVSKTIEFIQRTREEMSFPDEVDTPVDVPARQRFFKYRCIHSMRDCVWDPFESLPGEYLHINAFDNYKAIINESKNLLVQDTRNAAVQDKWVRLTLSNVTRELYNKLQENPAIPLTVSTIMPLERKLSVVNFTLAATAEAPEILSSKAIAWLYCGFRRFPARPIFSRNVLVAKGKFGTYNRDLDRATEAVGTIYGMALAPTTPVVAMEPNSDVILYSGAIVDADPHRIILKRIILTGYPIKVHKKRAVVRYMFFDPQDVKYYKPAQLHTSKGLRGRILEPLGTHGHFKCMFNDYVTQDDIVCLALYKRVYPKWYPDSWSVWL